MSSFTAVEKLQITSQVELLAKIYPSMVVDDSVFIAWQQYLSGIPMRFIQAAFDSFFMSTDEFPTPGKIRKIASEKAYEARIAKQSANRQWPPPIAANVDTSKMFAWKNDDAAKEPSKPKETPEEFEARKAKQIAALRDFANGVKDAGH